MKKNYLRFIGIIALVFSASVVAAENQASAQEDQKVQAVHDDAQPKEKEGQASQANAQKKKLVLPLDHGPRATVTPWQNEQRRRRAAEEEKQEQQGQEKSHAPDSNK